MRGVRFARYVVRTFSVYEIFRSLTYFFQIEIRQYSFRLMARQLTCHDSISGKKYWFQAGHGSGASRTLLPNSLKIAFRTKQVVCVEYDNIREEQEREVFQVSQFLNERRLISPDTAIACPVRGCPHPRR